MLRKFIRRKIHRPTVIRADLHYEGSISIDEDLLNPAGLSAFEAVHIWDISNGERLETYIIAATRGSGEIRLNGAAARLAQCGGQVIMAAFGWLAGVAPVSPPKVVLVDEKNRLLDGGAH